MSSNEKGTCKKSCSAPCFKSTRHYRPSLHIDNYDVCVFGDKKSGFRSSVGPQDYFELRKYHLENKTLFEDTEFIPTYETLYPTPHEKIKKSDIDWLRPQEISGNPRFFADGYSRFNIKQGYLRDCWFVAAAAVLTLYPKIFEFVVPLDQEFDEQYAGIFHFRFWQYGVWVDVVVDDRLPVHQRQLFYVQSVHPNEYWSALLEKAYAKLHGSYDSLNGSWPFAALEDFTGGIGEHFALKPQAENIFGLMFKADERLSFMCTSINGTCSDVKEILMKNGLLTKHAYSITKIDIANGTDGFIPLIRLRNPSGKREWNGRFSDSSTDWEQIPEDEQKRLGVNFQVDGEFWMHFDDYLHYFDEVDVCNLNPHSFLYDDYETKKRWEMTIFEDEWVIGVTAGGFKNVESFSINPQFEIVLTETDEDDEEKLCSIIVSLLQKTHRQSCRRSHGVLHPIIVVVYEIFEHDPKPLSPKILGERKQVCKSQLYETRGVVLHSKLPPGKYCIIPACNLPDQEAQFILRVFTEKPVEISEYDKAAGYSRGDENITEQMKQMEYENSGGDLNKSLSDRILSSEEKEAFRMNAGEDETIDWEELRTILNSTIKVSNFKGFSADTCRFLLSRHDGDRSTKLDYYEYSLLWKELHKWTVKNLIDSKAKNHITVT